MTCISSQEESVSSLSSLSSIYTISNKDQFLNNPGLIFFKIDENKYISNQRINLLQKDMKKITDNIIQVFDNISKALKFQQEEKFKKIIKKLEGFSFTSKASFKFPGLQVINFEKEMLFPFIQASNRILICEKSDGVRYFLILFKNGKSLFLNRREEFFLNETTVILPSSSSTSSLMLSVGSNINHINEWEIENILDGELILDKVKLKSLSEITLLRNETNLVFLKKPGEEHKIENLFKVNFIVFDAIVLKNENIGHLPFRIRLEKLGLFGKEIEFHKFKYKYVNDKINKNLSSYYLSFMSSISNPISNPLHITNLPKPPMIDVYIKDYFTFDKFESTFKFCSNHNFPHENDGIIINFDDYPYYPGTSDEIFKWKPIHTIDFEMKQINNEFILYIFEGREKISAVSVLSFQNEEEKEEFNKEYLKVKNRSSIIVECYYDRNFKSKKACFFNYLLENVKDFLMKDGYSINIDMLADEKSVDFTYMNTYCGGWRFMRFRNDKTTGNYISTYKNIIKTIKDDLSIEEISRQMSCIDQLKKERVEWGYLTGNSLFLKEIGKGNCNLKDGKEGKSYGNSKTSNEFSYLNKKRDEKVKESSNDLFEKSKESDLKFPINPKKNKENKEEDSFELCSIEDFSDYN